MRISWVSNAPWARTGYGNQTNLFVPRIQALGHECAITAFYGLEGGVLNWNGVPVYPRAYHPYGNDIMAAHATHFKADIMISLIDAWVYEPHMFQAVRWVPWFPIDHDPAPKAVLSKVARAWQRIVYSRFAETQMKNAGLDCHYVPHGIDTNQFQPGNRAEMRAGLKWPDDKFVVGMIAANKGNPSRKAFAENIAAFAKLKQKHPDVMLYLHTVSGEENAGVNLREYLELCGLSYGYMGRDDAAGKDVMFNDQYAALVGLPDSYMNSVYNSLDVMLLVSMGEGFGIPLVEAQACGCPVITGDWTASGELVFGGWKVARSDAIPFYTPMASFQFIPRMDAIADLLEVAYNKAGKQAIRDKARAGALAYDADKVTAEYWVPVLAELQAMIDGQDQPVKLVKFA